MLERKYTEKGFCRLFKTITVDNGTEFADFDGLKRSQRNKKDTGMDEPLPPE
jgi:IS30 family transposase